MNRSAFLSLFCCCLGFLPAGSASGQGGKTIRVDRREAELLHVVDGWAIWRTSEHIDNGGSRKSLSEHHFYRQRIPDPNAHLVLHAVEGTGFRPFQAIADDGTLIALIGDRIRWFRPDGTVKESGAVGLNRMRIRAYPDGVMLRVSRPRSAVMSHVFVPFRGEELDFQNQIEIRSWGDRLWRAEPVRCGSVMAWNTPEGLRRLDLKTGMRSVAPFDGKNQTEFNLRNANVTAFDGELVLLGSNVVVDAMTGHRIATNWDDKRINRLFLTHDGIGYRVHEGKLEAIDIRQPNQPAVFLSLAPHQPIASTKSGLLLWTGDKWKTIPWYIASGSANDGRTKR